MRPRLRQLTVLPLLLLALRPSTLLAQRSTSPLPRWGVVVGFGVGRGDGEVKCSACHGSRSGPSMHGRVGGALREDLLIAAEIDGFASSGPPSTFEATTSLLAMTVVAQWYPRNPGGYFVSAGMGGGRAETSFSSPLIPTNTSPLGPAFKIGTGYDIALSRALAVTPFASFLYVSGGTPRPGFEKLSGNVLLFGVTANLDTRQLMN